MLTIYVFACSNWYAVASLTGFCNTILERRNALNVPGLIFIDPSIQSLDAIPVPTNVYCSTRKQTEYANELRKIGVHVRRVHRAKDESHALIRLADALAGLAREAAEGNEEAALLLQRHNVADRVLLDGSEAFWRCRAIRDGVALLDQLLRPEQGAFIWLCQSNWPLHFRHQCESPICSARKGGLRLLVLPAMSIFFKKNEDTSELHCMRLIATRKSQAARRTPSYQD